MQFSIAACANRRVLTGVIAGATAGLILGAGLVQNGRIEAPARMPAPLLGTSLGLNAPSGLTTIAAPARDRSLQLESGASELNCLTQAVYFEARGETQKGQAAVAEVILNRVKHPAFPKTVCGVVYQGAATGRGCQFSFACDGAVERVSEDGAWRRAHRIAAQVLAGVVLADIGGATHFHTTGVSPAWGDRMRLVTRVGTHIFYRFGAPRLAPPPTLIEAAEPEVQFVNAPSAPQIVVTATPLAEAAPALAADAPAHAVDTAANATEAPRAS
ncbi:cell wall hydrolase [Phenylobacterium immobile]|uniref:cell wall hydrolase n=1 Tax=Phenylobacterium immobile TaxID=21 RepID=UPI000A621D16|nr:cell wall hydrolase [Phenylobacterium immobile]